MAAVRESAEAARGGSGDEGGRSGAGEEVEVGVIGRLVEAVDPVQFRGMLLQVVNVCLVSVSLCVCAFLCISTETRTVDPVLFRAMIFHGC